MVRTLVNKTIISTSDIDWINISNKLNILFKNLFIN